MMTNEEAIKALKRIRDEAINNFVGDWQDYEAFGIALKVLADRKDEPQTEVVTDCHRLDEPQTDEEYINNLPWTEVDAEQTDCAWKKGE